MFCFAFSEVTIHWDIPEDMEEGHYRIRHMGYHRTILRLFSVVINTS